MGTLGRTIFLEATSNALLGTVLFTFVLFLQRVSKLFEHLVRGSANLETTGYLFTLLLPYALTFTIPVGVLVGVLIALSRMSADSEITAMRATGIPARRVLPPVLALSLIGMVLTAAASLWLTPWSIRQTYRVLNRIVAAQLTADIQPRVFEEQFPNTILYVGDVISGPVVRWKNVFLADITPAEQRKPGAKEAGEGPKITVAAEALAVPDVERNRLQLTLTDASTHEAGKERQEYYSTTMRHSDQVLEAVKRSELKPFQSFPSMDTVPLIRAAATSLEARIELHQRLALPPACVLLALIGIPLGASSRKGGKSSAFVLTVCIAFLYYMGLISLVGLARQGTLPAGIALWLPNMVLTLLAASALARLERPGDRDVLASITTAFRGWLAGFRERFRIPSVRRPSPRRLLGPQIVDNYILFSFLFYFALLLSSFVVMTHVYTFFELLSDILKNAIPMATVGRYLFFLTPKLIYDSTPMSVLVAVLVTFGILTKNNEVTAFKACGVSLYRLAIPVMVASTALSGGLFAFDHYIVPEANRIQDAIRNQIKGRVAQTYLRPDRKWIFGEGSRIYYYKYFDQNENVMVGVKVFELDPNTFHLKRHIEAERARWERSLNTWIFQNGWWKDIGTKDGTGFRTFQGQTATFGELTESPSWFLREAKQDKQMNFRELATYIRELQQSGFDTIRLQVQFHKKFAVPLFALIMALISIPFSFAAANRGAMAAIGVSFTIAVAYVAVSQLFEQIGYVNQLPAALAAWSPDAVFSLAGLYFLARVRT